VIRIRSPSWSPKYESGQEQEAGREGQKASYRSKVHRTNYKRQPTLGLAVNREWAMKSDPHLPFDARCAAGLGERPRSASRAHVVTECNRRHGSVEIGNENTTAATRWTTAGPSRTPLGVVVGIFFEQER
jgi:hypothetical protein